MAHFEESGFSVVISIPSRRERKRRKHHGKGWKRSWSRMALLKAIHETIARADREYGNAMRQVARGSGMNGTEYGGAWGPVRDDALDGAGGVFPLAGSLEPDRMRAVTP